MKAANVLCLALLIPPLLAGASTKILRLDQAGAVTDAIVVVEKAVFTNQFARDYSIEFGKQHLTGSEFVRVTVFTDTREAREFIRGRPEETHSYEEWLAMRQARPQTHGAMAQAVFSAKGAVLRFRSEDGTVKTEVLWGQDPTLIYGRNAVYEILHIWLAGPAPLFRNRPEGDRGIEVFVRTSARLELEPCKEITHELAGLFRVPMVFTEFRNDAIFAYGSRYPLVHLLYDIRVPPSVQAYIETRTVGCSETFGNLGCIWSFPNPE
jgi:hypothetical protein